MPQVAVRKATWTPILKVSTAESQVPMLIRAIPARKDLALGWGVDYLGLVIQESFAPLWSFWMLVLVMVTHPAIGV